MIFKKGVVCDFRYSKCAIEKLKIFSFGEIVVGDFNFLENYFVGTVVEVSSAEIEGLEVAGEFTFYAASSFGNYFLFAGLEIVNIE